MSERPPEKNAVVSLAPQSLSPHPARCHFPGITARQREMLKDSIREKGVLKPLVAVWPTPTLLIDGVEVARVAAELGVETVPVVVRSVSDPLAYALETALIGRQLTKTGAALLLWDAHPELAGKRPGRKKNVFSEYISDEDEPPSWRGLAERYRLPKDYFSLLAAVFGKCEDDREAEAVRRFILEDETPAPRLQGALIGWREGGDAEGSAPGRAPTDHEAVFTRSFKSLKNCFDAWDELPPPVRQKARELWFDVVANLPKELR